MVQRPAAVPHRYQVKFVGDPVARERFIHPDWQSDPERALSLLHEFWRAEEASVISDFFPDA